MSNVRRPGSSGRSVFARAAVLLVVVLALAGCAAFKGADTFRDPNMDFGAIHTIAVMPFANLSRDNVAGDRVRDVFTTALLATGAVYALPPGEVNRGIIKAGIANPVAPSAEEIVKLGGFVKADAVLVGTLKEYGEVRSGSAAGNVISLSLQLIECQTGRIVWSGSTTRGGVSITDRLFGGGGEPMNIITEKAVNDLLEKLLP